MEEQPRRSWWGRHWKWVVPVGCLGSFLLCAGCVTLIVTVLLGAVKSVAPYKQSLAIVQTHPQARSALGDSIEPGVLVFGNINISGTLGHASLEYSVSGTAASGTVYVAAEKMAGVWRLTNLTLTVSETDESLDLLSPE